MLPTSETVRVTSRARITHVERDVSSLWSAVRSLEAKLGCVPTDDARALLSPLQMERLSAQGARDRPDDANTDSDSDSNSSNLSSTNPPMHFLQLFDNGLLGSRADGPATSPRHASTVHKAHGRSALRELMPSREDMLTVSAYAASWLSMYNLLFPIINVTRSSQEMLSEYDKLQDPNADLVAIATLLLSVALTVQVAPNEIASGAAKSIRNASMFIKDVSDTVERIVVLDDALAGTLEGIETTLLFLRL